MHFLTNSFLKNFLFLATILSLGACKLEPDPDEQRQSGTLKLEITDAPIDDPAVAGVFITVKDVEIYGKSWPGFDGKKTFDLMSLQAGKTLSLGTGELDAGVYTGLELILDNVEDASGEVPANYVLLKSGAKIPLSQGEELIVPARQNFECVEDTTTTVVYDFNLRKAITYASVDNPVFEFVSDHELETIARVIEKDEAGHVQGSIRDYISNADKIIVYAYQSGGFEKETAVAGQGPSQIQFKDAVTSSVVDENGSYHIGFLEPGNYDLVFVVYKDEDYDGRLEISGACMLDRSEIEGILSPVEVDKGTKVTLDVVVEDLLPISKKENSY